MLCCKARSHVIGITERFVTPITSGCDAPCCAHASPSFMIMQSKWEEQPTTNLQVRAVDDYEAQV
jgi:hypothetical protein